MNDTAAELTGYRAIGIMSNIFRSPAGREFRFAKTSCGELEPKKLSVSVRVGLWLIKSYGFRTALQRIRVIYIICETCPLLLSMRIIELIGKTWQSELSCFHPAGDGTVFRPVLPGPDIISHNGLYLFFGKKSF